MREEVTLHPRCDDFGIQQLVTHESIPEDATMVHMRDCTSASEFRKTLTNMDDSVQCVFLSEGVDLDGTVHENEVVMFRRLSIHSPLENVHVLLYHFRLWRRAVQTPQPPSAPTPPRSPPQPSTPLSAASPSASSYQSEPSWLTEAEVQVESTPPATPSRTVGLPDIPEMRTASPPPSTAVVPTYNTILVHDSTTVLTIDGVITPTVLMSLANPSSIVYLPTRDGARMPLTRVRNAIWFGTYIVDTTSWTAETCTYRVTPRANHSQFAPRHSVAQMHRIRRRQFERR